MFMVLGVVSTMHVATATRKSTSKSPILVVHKRSHILNDMLEINQFKCCDFNSMIFSLLIQIYKILTSCIIKLPHNLSISFYIGWGKGQNEIFAKHVKLCHAIKSNILTLHPYSFGPNSVYLLDILYNIITVAVVLHKRVIQIKVVNVRYTLGRQA